MNNLQREEEKICTDCGNPIKGEYYVKKKDEKEEFYHPHCARKSGKLTLPIQIRFTLSIFSYKLIHIFEHIHVYLCHSG